MLGLGFGFDPGWLFGAYLLFGSLLMILVPLSAFILLGAGMEIVGYRRLKPKTRELVQTIKTLGVVLTVAGCVIGMCMVVYGPKDESNWWLGFPGLVTAGLARLCLWRDARSGPF